MTPGASSFTWVYWKFTIVYSWEERPRRRSDSILGPSAQGASTYTTRLEGVASFPYFPKTFVAAWLHTCSLFIWFYFMLFRFSILSGLLSFIPPPEKYKNHFGVYSFFIDLMNNLKIKNQTRNVCMYCVSLKRKFSCREQFPILSTRHEIYLIAI